MGCDEPVLLAEDFLFIFPVVGPLKKEEFVEVFQSIDVKNMIFMIIYNNAIEPSFYT